MEKLLKWFIVFALFTSYEVKGQSLDSLLFLGVKSVLDSSVSKRKGPLESTIEEVFFIKNLSIYSDGRISFLLLRETKEYHLRPYSFSHSYKIGSINVYFVDHQMSILEIKKYFLHNTFNKVTRRRRKKLFKKLNRNSDNLAIFPWVAQIMYNINNNNSSMLIRHRDKCD